MTDEIVPLADLARRINEAYSSTLNSMRTAVEQAIECGRLLTEAKAQVDHGEWKPWLEANTTVSDRTARLWMRYSEHSEILLANRQSIAVLTFADADKLIAEHNGTKQPKPAPAKPKQPSAETKKALDVYDRLKAAGEEPTYKTIQEEAGVSATPVRRAFAIRDAETTAAAEAEIALSGTAQQKLEAAIRAHKRKLDLEFDARLQAECQKWADDMRLPMYEKRLEEMARMLKWPSNAVMTKSEYNTILRCLHPDGLKSRTEQQLAEAFRIFTHYKLKMIADEDERQKFMSGLPRTREELLARKKPRARKSNGAGAVRPRSL